MTQCFKCGKKARRSCPLNFGRPICASCCRQIIEQQKNCPADCPHLKAYGAYQQEKQEQQLVRRISAEPRLVNINRQALSIINTFENEIAKAVRTDSSFTDEDIREALENIEQAYRARSLGLYTTNQVLTHRASVIFKSLSWLIFDKKGAVNKSFSREVVLDALKALTASIARHRRPGQQDYIELIKNIY